MCELTTGYNRGNCASVGGVDTLYIYNLENRDSFTRTGNEVTALSMLSTKQAFALVVDKESSSFTQTQTRSRENNSVYYEVSGQFMLKDDENTTTDFLELIGGGFFGVIAKTASGKYFHYGIENGLTVETSEITTGQSYEDLNGATINLTGKEKTIAPYLDGAIADAILVPAP